MSTARKWLAGAVISTALMWLTGMIFCDSPGMLEWSEDMGGVRRASHVSLQFRSEGWATSRFGPLGLSGVSSSNDLRCPAVLVWGDSHVEALQVPDEEKLAGQLRAMMARDRQRRVALGMGISGEMVADYYFKMAKWESLVPCVAHYVVITSLSELLPDQPDATYAHFTAKPSFALVAPSPRGFSVRRTRVQKWLRTLRLEFVVALYHKVLGGGRDGDVLSQLRFSLGPAVPPIGPTDSVPTNASATSAAWDFLLARLAAQTTNPVTIVYAPLYPGWKDHRLIGAGTDGDQIARLADACRARGVGFIDLGGDFCRWYEQTGRFPRGFPNGRPGVGHFNADGHRLIAAAIYRDLRRRDRALHTN